MKQILLLGGYGFLGTNLLKYIDQYFLSDFKVIVFDKLRNHLRNISFNCVAKAYTGDFADNALLESVFKENKIDLIIHALGTTVPALPVSARYDVESNLISTIQLLDIVVKYNVMDVIFISSGGAIYGQNDIGKNKETDNSFPLSSYGVTKLAIEKYMLQYAALYGLRPLILRLSNPFGKYHYSLKQGVCNVALRQAIRNEHFKVWGDGNARKDYIFVTDFCDILLKLYLKNVHSCTLNIGSGNILSVNDILHSVKQLVPDFSWTYTNASVFDVSHVELDLTLLGKELGKYVFTPFLQGLDQTYQWLMEGDLI